MQCEVEILSKIQHPNIISLLGYSTNDTARFIVYELMPNISLESHLHGRKKKHIHIFLVAEEFKLLCSFVYIFSGASRGLAITITWPMRMKIALDIARLVVYTTVSTF